MRYRVNADAPRPVRWPDGSVRAEAGQVFEGHDMPGTSQHVTASRWLAGSRALISPEPLATVTAGQEMPPAMEAALRSRGWGPSIRAAAAPAEAPAAPVVDSGEDED